MQRFYSLSTSPTLFGGAALVREWGRIGSNGQRRVDLYDTEPEARAAKDEFVRMKQARGYRADVNGGRIPGHRGGAKAGQWSLGGGYGKGPDRGPCHIALPGLIRR